MIMSKQLVQEYRQQIGRFSYAQMDCITSIARIIQRYGGAADLMGSNWWARYEAKNMRPLTDKSQLYDGCGVLKTILPGEPGYGLPPRYKDHAVQIDYNHIGIGTDQGEILDSTTIKSGDKYLRNGPGVSTAPIGPKSWDVIFDFEDVDYSDRISGNAIETGEGESVRIQARVIAQTGNTVNLRSRASTNSTVLEYVKVGTVVEVQSEAAGWKQIITPSGKTGWMKAEFLSENGLQDTSDVKDPDMESPEAMSDYKEKLAIAAQLLNEAASLVREAVDNA